MLSGPISSDFNPPASIIPPDGSCRSKSRTYAIPPDMCMCATECKRRLGSYRCKPRNSCEAADDVRFRKAIDKLIGVRCSPHTSGGWYKRHQGDSITPARGESPAQERFVGKGYVKQDFAGISTFSVTICFSGSFLTDAQNGAFLDLAIHTAKLGNVNFKGHANFELRSGEYMLSPCPDLQTSLDAVKWLVPNSLSIIKGKEGDKELILLTCELSVTSSMLHYLVPGGYHHEIPAITMYKTQGKEPSGDQFRSCPGQ